MKKRMRGMTSASQSEKKGKRKHWRRDGPRVEREWQNDARARERVASGRRGGGKRRRNEEAVGHFARAATLSCERGEETQCG